MEKEGRREGIIGKRREEGRGERAIYKKRDGITEYRSKEEREI